MPGSVPASTEMYRQLVEAAVDIIYCADRDGCFTYFNPTAVRLLDYEPDEILGRLFLDLIHPDYRRAAKRFYVQQVRRQTPTTYYEYPAIARDGRVVWLGQHVQLVWSEGQIVGVQAVARDITARRSMETELKEAHSELAQRVQERTAELTRINESLLAEVTERQRLVGHARRLMEIGAAINRSLELDDILSLVRSAIVEAGGFDRAGVFTVDGDVVHGAWGTDEHGAIRDEHYLVENLYDWGPRIQGLITGEQILYIEELGVDSLPPGLQSVHIPHAVIPLRTGGELVGLISIDNLLTGRPVTPETVGALLPFTEQAEVAIRNARLLAERTRHLKLQDRLAALAAATGAGLDLRTVLRMAREYITEACGFDRAGIFVYDPAVMALRGVCGTDRDGGETDGGGVLVRLPVGIDPAARTWAHGEMDVVLYDDFTAALDLAPGDLMYGVKANASIYMRSGDAVVGMVGVDNLLSGAPITRADIERLLPFAEQAAVAIWNARLVDERERHLEMHRRIAAIAAATSRRKPLPGILRIARDSAVEVCGFDRAAVFVYDAERGTMCGVCGTSREGEAIDTTGAEFNAPVEIDRRAKYFVHGELECILFEDMTASYGLAPDNEMYGVHANGAVFLRADDALVGMLCVDNFLRDAPISAADMERLMPLAEQAAVAIRDARLVSDLHHAQEALVHSEKLRAVGELASGVAHNVNNVLMAVMGYAELIPLAGDNLEEVHSHAATILQAASDGADVVRRLQQFARKETAARQEVFDLSTVVMEAVNLTRPAWHNQAAGRGTRFDVTTDMAPGLLVHGIASEIREVIVNLVRNAIDAMESGGSISVRCWQEPCGAAVEVADSGSGMDIATLHRVFEPFFTTKGPGKGTGLGLSVAWGIVDRHGGRITAESLPGGGSVFRIVLPAAAVLPKDIQCERQARTIAGTGILLAEDDETVRQSLAAMLTSLGAHVEATTGGEAALSQLESCEDGYDILVSDQAMVGMTGIDLLSRVRERWPGVRRVLLSGWGADLSEWPAADAAELILSKPVGCEALEQSLGELLAR